MSKKGLIVLFVLLLSGCGNEILIRFEGDGGGEATYITAISFECPEGFAKTHQAINDNSIIRKNIVCTRVIK